MATPTSIDWEAEETLRAIIADARMSAKAPRDAIERAYTLIVKEKNAQFPHLEWSWYSDTNYRIHLRVRARNEAG